MWKFGFWGHLFDAVGLELWSKYILGNLSFLRTHLKLEVIANVQIISYKIDPEVFVYLNISREVYLALQTGIN